MSGTVSISIGGEGTYPTARDGVAHAIAEPEHRTILIVDSDWIDKVPDVYQDQEDALHWRCLTCNEPENGADQ